MIKIEHVISPSPEQMKFVIEGMRNAKNSWEKSDSEFKYGGKYEIGVNDWTLMQKLAKAGTDHRKFMRMIPVYARITAPLYWWSEFDTYKVGTVANSCSKMHKLLSKPFEMSDFSFDKLPGYKFEPKQYRLEVDEDMEEWLEIDDAQDSWFVSNYSRREIAKMYGVSHTCINDIVNDRYKYTTKENIFENFARPTVDTLNELRDAYFNSIDQDERKQIWYSIIQLLPSSYNQTRNVMLNYEVLANIYKSRRNHKLDEWRYFCSWIETLPYSELITSKSGPSPEIC